MKKVIDILPPQKEVEKREIVKEKIEIQSRTPEIEVSVPFLKKSLVFILLFLISGSVFCYFYLPKAKVEIWPEVDNLNFKTQLTVDKKVGTADFSSKIIPVEIFEKEKSLTENYPATGKVLKEGKAEGMITVYNAYSTVAQSLIANTRFVTSSGKVFRTLVKVTIPGGYYEKGKLIPGEVEIRVVADSPGVDCNITPSTFAIPGFAGTEKYTKFYAKSFQDFTGGFSQEFLQVTKEDLDKAKIAMTKKVKEECESAFKSTLQSEEISSRFYFLERAIQTEVVETFSLAAAGDIADNFNYQVKAVSKTLIFLKEDLNNFGKEFMRLQMAEGKKLAEETLKIDFVPETINLSSDKITLSLTISAKAYSDIDLSGLKNMIKKKSLPEAKMLLSNQPEIIKVEAKGWPFWVKNVPRNSDKISIDLRGID